MANFTFATQGQVHGYYGTACQGGPAVAGGDASILLKTTVSGPDDNPHDIYCLYRASALIAADDEAHQVLPALPTPSDHERQIIEGLRSAAR